MKAFQGEKLEKIKWITGDTQILVNDLWKKSKVRVLREASHVGQRLQALQLKPPSELCQQGDTIAIDGSWNNDGPPSMFNGPCGLADFRIFAPRDLLSFALHLASSGPAPALFSLQLKEEPICASCAHGREPLEQADHYTLSEVEDQATSSEQIAGDSESCHFREVGTASIQSTFHEDTAAVGENKPLVGESGDGERSLFKRTPLKEETCEASNANTFSKRDSFGGAEYIKGGSGSCDRDLIVLKSKRGLWKHGEEVTATMGAAHHRQLVFLERNTIHSPGIIADFAGEDQTTPALQIGGAGIALAVLWCLLLI
ncbi:hypothetical protein FB451DRAFT_1177318 [Mycena latifolia]|nr:hypothetical protein FB451DRAFT_1177318 [Mycena latifolia]